MTAGSAYYASQLRHELSLRNRAFALQRQLAHVESRGGMAVTVYQPHPTRLRHGNFFDESYAAMLAIPEWRKRLEKVHTQAKSSLPSTGRGWKELDSSMSSDALLMNIFCCPYVADDPRLLGLLGIDTAERPEFGWRARVPLKNGLADRTEVDMKLGNMLFEAKLTESDFQTCDAVGSARLSRLRKGFRGEGPSAGGEEAGFVSTDPQCAGCACERLRILRLARRAASGPDGKLVRDSPLRSPCGAASAVQGADLAGIKRGLAGATGGVPRPEIRHCCSRAFSN